MEQDPEFSWMNAMARQLSPRRGDVWLVALDPTVGHEIQKTRPAVVVTSDLYNRQNWVILVMPLTSHDSAEIDQVLILPPEGGLSNRSVTCPISCEPLTGVGW